MIFLCFSALKEDRTTIGENRTDERGDSQKSSKTKRRKWKK